MMLGIFLEGVLHFMCKCKNNTLVLGLCRSTQVELVGLVTQVILTTHLSPQSCFYLSNFCYDTMFGIFSVRKHESGNGILIVFEQSGCCPV